jgi:multidrug resistance efflux pump
VAGETEIEGYLKKLHVAPGDTVKAGDLLVEIDARLTNPDSPKTKVFAPSDSTVLSIPVIERQWLSPESTRLMYVGDLSKLFVDCHVSEADAPHIFVNQPLEITTDSLPNDHINAEIISIGPNPIIKDSVRGFHFRALVTAGSTMLRPGMAVHVTIPESARTVPR